MVSLLKINLMSKNLKKNYGASRCRAHIIYFRATKDSEQSVLADDLFNWQPHTDKPVSVYETPVTHGQMLWQPVSYKFIASKVREVMRRDKY
jgi:hypothetical protein